MKPLKERLKRRKVSNNKKKMVIKYINFKALITYSGLYF